MDYGKNLKVFRKEKGLTQEQIIIHRPRHLERIIIVFQSNCWIWVKSKRLPEGCTITFQVDTVELLIEKLKKYGVLSDLDVYRMRYSEQYPIQF